jgi:O-antigen/teichoic acid export membrane protein
VPVLLRRLLGAQWLAIAFIGGVSFLLSVFIALRFGPETFGVYAKAVTLGTLLAIVIDGGFGKLLMREAAPTTPALAPHAGDLHGFAFGHALLVMTVLSLVAATLPLPLHGPTLLATVAAFGMAVVGSLSLAILRGDLFKVLSLMLVFALANGVIGQGVFALGEDRRYVWTATAAAVFNVGGNLSVMPAYGVWGAAWMTVATEIILGAGLLWTLAMAWQRKLREGVSV